ncbi:TraB/GumN family protein [Limibacter armeniacum]|uniref:TraB/GumN family protein n=1 Tax=Limibacter armeniacum TaxID=466084 RepID=UPI002FE5B151
MIKSSISKLLTLSLILSLVCTFSLSAQQANSLLWEIKGKTSVQPSYLYGTFHIKDKRVFQFNDSLMNKLESCEAYAGEVSIELDSMQQLMRAILLPEGKSLKDFYSDKEYKIIKTYFEKLEKEGKSIAPFAALEKMKPFALLGIISSEYGNSEMESAMDEYLWNLAKSKGKEMKGVESISEQLNAFEKLPPQIVVEAIEEHEKSGKQIEKMIEYYSDENIEKLHDLIQKDKTAALYAEELLDKRNEVMAERIAKMTDTQPTFITIGAGHLAGKTGVLQLLKKKGYKVRPIMNSGKTNITDDKYAHWIKVSPENEPYSILMPGKPELIEQKINSELGSITIKGHQYKSAGTAQNLIYMMVYTKYPSTLIHSDMTDQHDTFFQNAISGILQKVSDSELLSQEAYLYKTYPGRKIKVAINNGQAIISARVVLIENRVYMMQAISTKEFAGNEMQEYFFDSFQASGLGVASKPETVNLAYNDNKPEDWVSVQIDDELSINMPIVPTEEVRNVEEEGLGNIEIKTMMVTLDSGSLFGVLNMTYPKGTFADSTQHQSTLHSTLYEMFNSFGSRPESEAGITYEGHNGFQGTSVLENNVQMTMRNFILGDRMCLLFALIKDKNKSESDIDHFMNSLNLNKVK